MKINAGLKIICHQVEKYRGKQMKTQEEYAREIDEIVRRDVRRNQGDWFNIDKPSFMLPENKYKTFILAIRELGSELMVLGGNRCKDVDVDRILGCLSSGAKFYICFPIAYLVKVISEYFAYNNLAIVYKDMHWKLAGIK